MTANPYNPGDPEFLLSRDLDADLSGEERRLLHKALSDSADLREQADDWRRIHDMVVRWGREPVSIDWNTHADLVAAHVSDGPSQATERELSQVLRDWAAQSIAVDEDRFTQAVLTKIRARRRVPAYSVILKWGAPLAAAAVFGLMVTATTWFTAAPKAVSIITLGSADMVEPGAPIRSVVSFGRTAPEAPSTANGIGLLSMGASPMRFGDAGPL